MTNKYETLYSQIGACVDKLIERGFEFENISIARDFLNTLYFYPDNKKYYIKVYFYKQGLYCFFMDEKKSQSLDRCKEVDILYSKPNWQEQLLNKVDELLKENK